MSLDERQTASRDQFERQSQKYGKSHILADTSDVADALASVDSLRPGRALDVATGGGHTAVYLAGLGWDVTASDLSPAMIERTRELANERGVSLKTAIHEAEKLPYGDKMFDLVTCRVAPHHFSDPAAFVREVKRVLSPGGLFLLIDGSVPDGEAEAEEWLHSVEKLRDPSHGRLLSPQTWTRLCKEAGLTVMRCTTAAMKQPDLNWYFDTAATSEGSRKKVLELVRNAPESAKRAFHIGEENGKIIWWWPRLTLIACRMDNISA